MKKKNRMKPALSEPPVPDNLTLKQAMEYIWHNTSCVSPGHFVRWSYTLKPKAGREARVPERKKAS